MIKTIKKLSAFSLGPIIAAMISFINVPIITHFIPPEEYGKASMFTLAQGIISMLLYLGMDQAFMREYNSHKEQKWYLLFNAMSLPTAILFVLEITIVAFHGAISIFLFGDSKEIVCIISLMIMLPAMLVERFLLSEVRMAEKGIEYSFFIISLRLITLILTVIFLVFIRADFRSAILAVSLGEVTNATILLIKKVKHIETAQLILDQGLIKRLFSFGIPLVPTLLLVWVFNSTDRLMIRAMVGYNDLGIYSAAYKVVAAIAIAQSCFTTFWSPIAYRWYEEGKDTILFEKVSQIVSFTMTILCLVALYLKQLMPLLFGGNYKDTVYLVPFLMLYPVLYTMSESSAVGIGFSRKNKYNMMASLFACIVNIILNLFLIAKWGALGAAIATGVANVCFFWARIIFSRKVWYKFPIKDYIVVNIVIIVNCIVHTIKGYDIAYIISALSIAIVTLYYRPILLESISKLKHEMSNI